MTSSQPKGKANIKPSIQSVPMSSWVATLLLTCLWAILIGVIVGVILYGFGKLPSQVTAIVSSLYAVAFAVVAILVLILGKPGSWRTVRSSFNRVWGSAHRRLSLVFGIVIVSLVTIPVVLFNQPTLDPTSAVISLMNKEVSAAEYHDLALVDQIYTSDAVVKDAACQPGDQRHIWNGRGEIETRYRDLPQFLSLAHIIKQVTLIPNDSPAVKASATASTQGAFVMVAPDGSQKQISLGGNEQWEFSKIGDQWFITKFTFSIC